MTRLRSYALLLSLLACANASAWSEDLPRLRAIPLGPAAVSGKPESSIDLAAAKNQHWAKAEGFDTPTGHVAWMISFSLQGKPYLAVLAQGWTGPVFHRFAWRMNGDWLIGGARYRMGLDVNLLHPKEKSSVQVFRDGEDTPLVTRTIKELQRSSFAAGAPVVIGGHSYRFFHADDIDPRRQGLVFVENAGIGTGGFAAYIVNLSLLGAQAQGFRFDNGQTLALRLASDKTTLEIFEMNRVSHAGDAQAVSRMLLQAPQIAQ